MGDTTPVNQNISEEVKEFEAIEIDILKKSTTEIDENKKKHKSKNNISDISNSSGKSRKDLTIEELEALKTAQAQTIKKKVAQQSWTPEIENLMKSWGEKAAGLRWMHYRNGGYWKKWANLMGFSVIAISTLASIFSFSTVNSVYSTEFAYVIGSLNIFAAFISSMNQLYNPEQKSANHTMISRQFGTYYRLLTLELSLTRENRKTAEELTVWAKQEYDRLQQDSPPMSTRIIDQFENKFIDVENKPDIVSDHIVIYVNRN